MIISLCWTIPSLAHTILEGHLMLRACSIETLHIVQTKSSCRCKANPYAACQLPESFIGPIELVAYVIFFMFYYHPSCWVYYNNSFLYPYIRYSKTNKKDMWAPWTTATGDLRFFCSCYFPFFSCKVAGEHCKSLRKHCFTGQNDEIVVLPSQKIDHVNIWIGQRRPSASVIQINIKLRCKATFVIS